MGIDATKSAMQVYRSGEGYKRLVPHYDIERECVVWLELAPGDKQEFSGGGRNEEGWHFWATTYWRDESGIVWREGVSRALDCDGRLDMFDKSTLDIDSNEWITVERDQRDSSAEAAGY